MKSVNKVILLGHLGRDPELRYAASNTIPVARFSIATNESYKDDQGNWQERTEWHNVVAWRRDAEVISQYAKKGDRIYIEGRLQTRQWQDQRSGEKRYSTEVTADRYVLLGGRREGAAEPAAAAAAGAAPAEHYDQRPPEEVPGAVGSTGITDADIPF